jgi:hypothetical protein
MIMRTLLITGAIAMVVGFSGTLLTLFGPNTFEAQLVKFAIMLLLFLVILIGSYWFVMVPPGRDGGRERGSREKPSAGGAKGEAPREPSESSEEIPSP